MSRILRALGPFSRAGIPAFQTLGDTADVGSRALPASLPTIEVLGDFTSRARNLTSNLSKLLTSLRDEDGIERLMDLIYYVALSTNGYDQFGHYLRTTLLAGCNSLATVVNPACTANFIAGREQRARVQAQAAHAARPHPGRREPRQGDAPVSPPAGAQGRAAGAPANGARRSRGAGTAADGCAASSQSRRRRRPRQPQRKADPVVDYLLGDGQ